MIELFTAGTARGGTNIRTYALRSHSEVILSIDALLPLFKFMRFKIVSKRNEFFDLKEWSRPMPDIFFNQEAQADLEYFWGNASDVEISPEDWKFLLPAIQSRASLAESLLRDELHKIVSPTFSGAIINFHKILKSRKYGVKYLGIHENWTLEFFPVLAKLFPNAKFVIHLRDPRAVVYSSEFSEPDFSKRPPIITFARHLRKHLAIANYLVNSSDMSHRVHLSVYEDYLLNPEIELTKLCNFLGLKFEREMLNNDSFKLGDGSFLKTDWLTFVQSGNIWEYEGREVLAKSVELISGLEARLFNYKSESRMSLDEFQINRVNSLLATNARNALGWTDLFQDIHKEIRKENERRSNFMSIDILNKGFSKELRETFWKETHLLAILSREGRAGKANAE